MSEKHILVVSTSYPDVGYQAGQEAAGSFVSDFVEYLSQFVRVTAVVPTAQKETIFEQKGSFAVYRFPVPFLPLSLLKPVNPTHWAKIRQTMQAGQQAVQKMAQENEIKHIFALWALPSGYWAKQTGLPYSIWALGSDIWSLGKVPLIRQQLQNVLRQASHCFADGYQLAEDVREMSNRECHFLPSSRKLTLSKPKELATIPPYKLAFLGRWHTHKGIDLLMESLHLLNEDDWQKIKEVRIFGGGPLETLVKTETMELKQKGYPVTVGGYLDRDGATALYEWADYLLLPSRIESIPVLFSDALQTNCPLVAMPIGDLPRLMKESKVGVLAQNVSGGAFYHALQNLLHTHNPKVFEHSIEKMKNQFDLHTTSKEFLEKLSL